MALSGLCLAHCLLLPVMLATAPLALLTSLPAGVAGGLTDTEWFHAALIAPVVLVSGPALMRSGGFRVGVLGSGLIAVARR
jgi:predicted benzoate:H+ symporter BenE